MTSTHHDDALIRRVAADLRTLTRLLDEAGHPAEHGILGGEWGYGADHVGATFEMHPFWWGECTCGFDDSEREWEDAHPHADTCYQAELRRRGWPEAPVDLAAVAREWGLPEQGCGVHCTCGQQAAWQEWVAAHGHDPACPVVRPNFHHPGTGVTVRWYKYIGRGMELVGVTEQTWARAFADAVAEVTALTGPAAP